MSSDLLVVAAASIVAAFGGTVHNVRSEVDQYGETTVKIVYEPPGVADLRGANLFGVNDLGWFVKSFIKERDT